MNLGVRALAFSPNGTLLATAGPDASARLWSVATGAPIRTLTSPTPKNVILNRVNGVAFSPDGTLLATGGADNSAMLWDVATEAPVRTLNGPAISSRIQKREITGVAFSPDGTLLATSENATTRSGMRLWDVATGQTVGIHIGSPDPHGSMRGVAFSPDGALLATGGDAARLWGATKLDGCSQTARASAAVDSTRAPRARGL